MIIKNNIKIKEIDNYENIACDELHEKYLKVKDCLSRCGNIIQEISDKEQIKEILFSFLNSQKFIFE